MTRGERLGHPDLAVAYQALLEGDVQGQNARILLQNMLKQLRELQATVQQLERTQGARRRKNDVA